MKLYLPIRLSCLLVSTLAAGGKATSQESADHGNIRRVSGTEGVERGPDPRCGKFLQCFLVNLNESPDDNVFDAAGAPIEDGAFLYDPAIAGRDGWSIYCETEGKVDYVKYFLDDNEVQTHYSKPFWVNGDNNGVRVNKFEYLNECGSKTIEVKSYSWDGTDQFPCDSMTLALEPDEAGCGELAGPDPRCGRLLQCSLVNLNESPDDNVFDAAGTPFEDGGAFLYDPEVAGRDGWSIYCETEGKVDYVKYFIDDNEVQTHYSKPFWINGDNNGVRVNKFEYLNECGSKTIEVKSYSWDGTDQFPCDSMTLALEPCPEEVDLFAPPPYDVCDPEISFVIFDGHKSAISLDMGTIDITWNLPFMLALDDPTAIDDFTDDKARFSLVKCGKFSYDVFIYAGVWEVEEESTVQELIDFSEQVGSLLTHFVVNDEKTLKFTAEGDLSPGDVYSVLVTASVDNNESFNRSPGEVVISEEKFKVRNGFQRVVTVYPPDADYVFEVNVDTQAQEIEFSGNLPPELTEEPVVVGDTLYLFQEDDSLSIFNVLSLVSSSNNILFSVEETDMQSLIPDVTLSGDFAESVLTEDEEFFGEFENDDEFFGDLLGDFLDEDQDFLEKLTTGNDEDFEDFCLSIVESLDELDDCVKDLKTPEEPGQRRRLSTWRDIASGFAGATRKLGRSIRRGIDFIKQSPKFLAAIEKFSKKVVGGVKALFGDGLEKSFEFDERGNGELTCFGGIAKDENEASLTAKFALEVNYSARATFFLKIKVVVLEEIRLDVRGQYGLQGYIKMDAKAKAKGEKDSEKDESKVSYKAEPKEVAKASRRLVINVGPVPVYLSYQVSGKVFAGASVSVEGKMFVPFGRRWEYTAKVDYKRGRQDSFQRTSTNKAVDVSIPPTNFELRVKAELELGGTLSLDIFMYGILRGSMNTDLVLEGSAELTSDLTSVAIARPYFLYLSEFELKLVAKIRLTAGLNKDLTKAFLDLFQDRQVSGGCSWKSNRGKKFVWPAIEEKPTEIPKPIDVFEASRVGSAFEKALESKKDATTLKELFTKTGVADALFTTDIDVLDKAVKQGEFDFEVYKKEFPLYGIPEISIALAPNSETKICQGDDAIAFDVIATSEANGFAKAELTEIKWFSDFDGIPLQSTDTSNGWIVETLDKAKTTIRLKRQDAKPKGPYELAERAKLVLRATPAAVKVLPFFLNMQKEIRLTELFKEAPLAATIDCCDNSDCASKFTGLKATYPCISNVCRPVTIANLFGDSNQNGPKLPITSTGQLPPFTAEWNDKLSSLSVVPGYSILLCTDGNLEGDCDLYGPGQHNANRNDAYSSGFIDALLPAGKELKALFYKDGGFKGSVLRLNSVFGQTFGFSKEWNDQISSLKVAEGVIVTLCTDGSLEGECDTYSAGLHPVKKNDKYSSAKATQA